MFSTAKETEGDMNNENSGRDNAVTLIAQWVRDGQNAQERTWRLGELKDSVAYGGDHLKRTLLEVQTEAIVQGAQAVAIAATDWLPALAGQTPPLPLLLVAFIPRRAPAHLP